MPLATIKVIEDVFNEKQKQEIIRKVTDAIVSVEGEALRQFTVVMIEEVKSGDWGVGGNLLSATSVKEMAAGKSRS